jgi:hypothetical protein
MLVEVQSLIRRQVDVGMCSLEGIIRPRLEPRTDQDHFDMQLMRREQSLTPDLRDCDLRDHRSMCCREGGGHVRTSSPFARQVAQLGS